MQDVLVAHSVRYGGQHEAERVELPLTIPNCQWSAVDCSEGYVAVAANVVGYHGKRAGVFIWDYAKNEVQEKDGWVWGCNEEEVIHTLRISPKGGAVALATNLSRVVVHSAAKGTNTRVNALTVQHQAHEATVTSMCWGYRGLYTADAAGVIYEYDWLSSFRPTRLADLNEKILQIASNTFSVAAHVCNEGRTHLLVTTERRCLLLNVTDGMIITVRHKNNPRHAPTGGSFHATTGGMLILHGTDDSTPSLTLTTPPVNTFHNGIEAIQTIGLTPLSNLGASGELSSLTTLFNGNIVAAGKASCFVLNPYFGIVSEFHFPSDLRCVSVASSEIFCLLANNEIVRLHASRPLNKHNLAPAVRWDPVQYVTANTVAISCLVIVCAAGEGRFRKSKGGVSSNTSPKPVRILTPVEELERARRQVSQTVISGIKSTYKMFHSNTQTPVPYLVRVIITASFSTVALGAAQVEDAAIKEGIRNIVWDIVSELIQEPQHKLKTEKKPRKRQMKVLKPTAKAKAATIRSPTRKAAPPVVPNFNDIDLIYDDTMSPYSVKIKQIVAADAKLRDAHHAVKMKELLLQRTHEAASTAVVVVVLSTWDINPLQMLRDHCVTTAQVSALTVAVFGWHTITLRLKRKAIHRVCRDLIQNVWWAVEDEITTIEKRKTRDREEARQAAQLAVLQDIQARQQVPISMFKKSDEEDIMHKFDAMNQLIQARSALFAAVLCVVSQPCIEEIQHREATKIKEGMVAAMVKWAVDVVRSDDASAYQGQKEVTGDTSWEEFLPEEVKEKMATLKESVREEISNAYQPLIERHQQEIRDLGPKRGEIAAFEYERTPLWNAEWSKGLLLATDPPPWATPDGQEMACNPVDDPDVLPKPSLVWDGDWQTSPWRFSNGSYWERECGMFSILRRRAWKRMWVCPRTEERHSTLLTTQADELKDWTHCVITDILDREAAGAQ